VYVCCGARRDEGTFEEPRQLPPGIAAQAPEPKRIACAHALGACQSNRSLNQPYIYIIYTVYMGYIYTIYIYIYIYIILLTINSLYLYSLARARAWYLV